ncbi:hypothetical protein [Microvirga solisilvae]|uniref:hypothetical protein n=1 Tax=Microvirga solisilvae TaxID=2919498 RepID=UPI001FAF2451|nr:hypothetical protein [Microvirga solisilvae]
MKILAALSGVAGLAAMLCASVPSHATNVLARTAAGFDEGVHARFDSRSGQTHVTGRTSSDQCFFLTLPQEWRAAMAGMETRLKSASSETELTVNLRSSRELRGMPQADLASRDAALLQQDYENLLGRPAQSVSLASLTSQATRWSATWIDANLPSGPMTIETFIVPLSDYGVLELSFTNVAAKEEYEDLVRGLLAGLELRHGGGCWDRVAF